MNEFIDECADALDRAVSERTAITRLTDKYGDLTIEQAYQIQDERTRRRVAAGDRLIGAKLGLTARAKQVQMNVSEPVYGRLFASDIHPSEDAVPADRFIHPRVEPEIVFLLGEELAGPGIHAADALAATRSVCCGLEILDSRFSDFSFTAADVIADNASEAGIVLGSRMLDPRELDLRLLGLILDTDGEFAASATGAATVGHPAEAVAMLANWLGGRGEVLDAGSLIFTGGLTAAVPVLPGRSVTATFAHLGSVTVRGA
jgi:2-oxo-3-hexenedioate decarboxylase